MYVKSATVLLCLVVSIELCVSTPFRQSSTGVSLQGRTKSRGGGEDCPDGLNKCKCKSRKTSIDVTCEEITTSELRQNTNILKGGDYQIRYFNIRNCNIPRLEDHIFMGIKIQHLLIHNCRLKALAPASLSSQTNTLSHLVLSKNNLSEIPSEAMKHLKNLDHLNLNENEISTLFPNAFDGLSKLSRLTLFSNKIHRIDTNAFEGITKWQEPSQLPVDEQRDMQRLNLGRNRISQIPSEALSSLRYLEQLDFTENEIETIKENAFSGLDNLDQLILNYNKIAQLNKGMFSQMPKLSTLYIDHNQIKTVDKDTFLDIQATLSSLSLTGNHLEGIPSAALRSLHGLTSLHLNENKISVILDDDFQGYGEHIKYLWLQDNMIKDIPAPAFQDLHSLEWIKLYNNVLKTLHYELMEPVLDTLMHIDIHSNPLVCDCELRWYKQWIEHEWNVIEEEWLRLTFCTSPVDNKEHNIETVDLKAMFCVDSVKDKPSTRGDGGRAAPMMSYSWDQMGHLLIIAAFTQSLLI